MAEHPDLEFVRALEFDERLSSSKTLRARRNEADRLLGVLRWKEGRPAEFPVIAGFMGGTGTGKSTLFNSLVGRPVGRVGIRRPSTVQPLFLVHDEWEDALIRDGCVRPIAADSSSGEGLDAGVLTHNRGELRGLILVDTPDFDSVERANRVTAEHVFILCDVIAFVTSQEKYGDLAGLELLDQARTWGKRLLAIMNKAASDEAFEDFLRTIQAHDAEAEPVRIGRRPTAPEMIPDVGAAPGIWQLLQVGADPAEGEEIRDRERRNLRRETLAAAQQFEKVLEDETARIRRVNHAIDEILAEVSVEMENRLEAVVSDDVESQIKERLGNLLKKYDIFFTPRRMIRSAIRRVVGPVIDIVSSASRDRSKNDGEKAARSEDMDAARSHARLKPLESAVAGLNVRIAELLASDSASADLRDIAATDVPRWGPEEIRARFEEAFPGMERMLEEEFERFKQGLSGKDELKLYSAYTLWAFLLVTAEVVMGGGFTLLDALLNTAIVPFIPKWLLNMKILDLLREMGERLDAEYRRILRGILEEQATLYQAAFSGTLPDERSLERLRRTREGLESVS